MRKYQYETVAGFFVVIGLLCIAYMTVKLGKVSFFSDNTYVLYARFTSVSGLRVGNPVEMFGLEVGRIETLGMDQKDQLALVELKLKKDIKVYGDAVASIKTVGLIGDRYVSIDPGGSAEILKPGATIAQTQPPVDIGELIGKYAFGGVKKEGQ
ncbi:MAG: outer membrane lipid asymmetry maintenance protein MlaD [Deltaproteobacteria bacterium]